MYLQQITGVHVCMLMNVYVHGLITDTKLICQLSDNTHNPGSN